MPYKTTFEGGEVVSAKKAHECSHTTLVPTLLRTSPAGALTLDHNDALPVYSLVRIDAHYMLIREKIYNAQAKHV